MNVLKYGLLAVCLLGCSESTAPTTAGINDEYALHTVNGAVLPAEISSTDAMDQTYVMARTYAFTPDGTVELLGQYEPRVNESFGTSYMLDDIGSYARLGNTLTITLSDGVPRQAILSGNTLTFPDPTGTGYREVYDRQQGS